MATVTVNLEPLSLETAGGRELADQVEEAFQQVADACADDRRYRGKLKATVTVTYKVEFDPETNAAHVESGVKVTLPKRKAVGKAVSLRGGRLLAERGDHTQLELEGVVDELTTRRVRAIPE
jgi:hypothetical protein